MGKLTTPFQIAKGRCKDTTSNSTQQLQGQLNTRKKCANFTCSEGVILDTIGQVDHPPTPTKDRKYLQKRAKGAFFSKELARHLTTLDSPLNKAYRRTLFDCNSLLIQEGQKLTSRYCDSRWCNTCNRIRTAKLTNGYRKPLEAFLAPQFVTLTIPNVESESLKKAIRTMLDAIVLIIRSRRRKGIVVNGIRKLECTYNADRNDYHPHFHFILDGKENAEWLIGQWLLRFPDATKEAQHYRQADGNSLMELFKYTTKIVSKSSKGDTRIYIPALDVIFQAMHRVRTFQSFGNIRMVSEDIDDVQSDTYDIPYYESVVWAWEGNDWYSMLTGDPLTGYEPSARMMELVTEKMVV